MSENNLEMDENEIHYVYEDQEFVLDKEEINPELRDLICAEGSRALLVDGQYILTDSQAILLQEGDNNLTQYYINDNTEGFIVDGEDASVNSLFESTEILQLVEEDTNGDQQIIYYTNENPNTEEFTTSQDIPEQNGVEGIQDEDGNIYPFKRIKLEGQMLQFDEFVPKQENVVMSHQADDEHNSVQYAIMEDGNFQISSFSTETQPIEESESDKSTDAQLVDLSKITGRNLITGQTVTLHSYMEKLKKKLKNNNLTQKSRPSKKIYDDEVRRPELSDLLDRKISIGKTKSGKKIVGKIIHIERKGDALKAPTKESEEEEEEEEVDDNLVINDHLPENVAEGQDKDESPPPPAAVASESEEAPTSEVEKVEDQTRILVKKCSVSKDSFEQISKTLGGVMEMESVRKKLENKNIVVKLVEKRYVSETDTVIKSTSYSYGYMEKDTNQVVEDEVVEKWRFVPDQNTQDVLLGDHITSEGSEDDKNKSLKKKSTKFPFTTSLTIVISYGKGGSKTIRVNLNPAPGNLCTICAQYFKSNLQLRQHMHSVHNTYGSSILCEVCDKSFDNMQKLQEHKNVHVQEGKLFICSVCNKCFTSQSKLHKHLPFHDLYLRPLECSVCEVRCASEWALKKHLLTHTGIKPFSCDICNKQFLTQYDVNFHKKIHFPEKHFACNICLRTFSRHSNLLRHTEIHKGSGALYKCDICYCSYNYISSLTRHMVQNHIDAADFRKRIQKV